MPVPEHELAESGWQIGSREMTFFPNLDPNLTKDLDPTPEKDLDPTPDLHSEKSPAKTCRVAFYLDDFDGGGVQKTSLILAGALAERGYAVGAFARSADKLDGLVQQIEADGGKAVALSGDVTVRDDLEAAKAKLEAAFPMATA